MFLKIIVVPPIIQKYRRGSALLAVVLILAVISSMLSVGTAKLTQAAINSTSTNKITLQAQQYAASKADIVKATKYDELTAQNKTVISNSDGFYDEVSISAESEYPGNSNISQRECIIRVYKDSEALPRSSLKLMRYSVSTEASSVPQGSIIPWYGDKANIPDGFALCDGSNGTPDLRNRFLVGAGDAYKVSNIGGESVVNIKKENLPADGLTAFGYSCVGHYCTLGQGNFGEQKGEYMANPSKDGSNGWQDYFYFTAFSSILSNNWKGTKLENRPPYYALYYIMKL